jgi:hypothetical protein
MKDKIHHYDLLEEMILSRDRELRLQAQEYERRLRVLNGEGERIKEILKESVPREVFDRTLSALVTRIENMEIYKTKQEGRNQLTQYVPWIIAAVAIVFDYFKK